MTAGRSRARILADACLVGLFVLLICLPGLRNLTGHGPGAGTENRVRAPRPEWQWRRAYLTVFPAKFEAFYNDYFGHRDALIRWLTLAKVRWLHTSATDNVVVGHHGWLFYTVAPVGRDYEAVRPFTEEELATWRHLLEDRRDWLAARGIRYYFVIAPDKQSIYPEMLPSVLRRRPGSSRLDQLQAYMRAHSDLPIVDLREPLLEDKARERLFCLTDSHWNDRGGYLAYRKLMEVLGGSFSDLQPLPRSAFQEVSFRGQGGDLAHMLGLDNYFGEDCVVLAARRPRQAHEAFLDKTGLAPLPSYMRPFAMERAAANLPRAVMFRDSFASSMIPFLSEHFRRIVYEWQGPNQFNYALVEREKPDVVIQEMVERKLSRSWFH